MKFRLIIILAFLYMLPPDTFAQNVRGGVQVNGEKGTKEFLPGANIYWANTTEGTTTDAKGQFEIPWKGDSLNKLVASFVGYVNDTIEVTSPMHTVMFYLYEENELKEFVIEGRDFSISHIKPINMETIGDKELKKAACCNLSESFESNASVDVVYPDAVSGARAIQMLGLSGVYTQLLTENTPLTRGLSANLGLTFIPGPWVESIQITKGVGSVVNGYESMSGQINVEYLKPEVDKTDNYFVNLYGNVMGRGEANLHYKKAFNDKISTMLFVHGNTYVTKNDQNHDNFLDNPLSKQINVMNRWKRQTKKTEQVLGLRALYDNKTGGQLNFNPDTDKNTTNVYGIGVTTKLLEGFFKNGFLFPESLTRSMGIIASGKHHEYDSYFGLRKYRAEQNSGYMNVIFQDVLGNPLHNFKTGASFLYDDFRESYNDSAFSRTEMVPGAFFEYTYTDIENITVMGGIRSDYHNLYGIKFTPRFHFRYTLKEKTTFRASAGTGFRTPNIFIENASTLASSRAVEVLSPLAPEESMNAGGSITQQFKFLKNDAVLNVDYYYTQFINQVVVDMEDADKVQFYNLDGNSYSHSIQADVDVMPYKGLTMKAAYKNYLVRSTYSGIEKDKPMVPKHRLMFNVSYQTPSKKWKFDYISNYYGLSRVPSTSSNALPYQFPEKSKEYYIIHFQVTKLFKKFELYAGVENMLNFTQRDAIIAASEPFGSNFDASMVWGPLNGRNFYAGLRYSLKK